MRSERAHRVDEQLHPFGCAQRRDLVQRVEQAGRGLVVDDRQPVRVFPAEERGSLPNATGCYVPCDYCLDDYCMSHSPEEVEADMRGIHLAGCE